ncbi:MAG: undecaprenyl-diphosphate phosphatase [Rickettsiales bacterium]|jgi:undecaprenyl-diphosphatase|nr:undecaprenyl-diphosphate phosphatase [Rickettsiales bacterium]
MARLAGGTLILLLLNTLAEFLPISSTAHSTLVGRFFSPEIDLRLLLATSQLAIDLVLCFYFRKFLWRIARDFFFDRAVRSLCRSLILTSMPFLLAGALFGGPVRKYFYSSGAIALCLVLGGVFLLFVEGQLARGKVVPQNLDSLEGIEPGDMYRIGLAQMVSLVPGVSRLASTLGAALLLGLPRAVAVDFSFLISTPVGLAGALFDILGGVGKMGVGDFRLLLGYFIANVLFALFFVKGMLGFLKRCRLDIFGYYRIALGLVIALFF